MEIYEAYLACLGCGKEHVLGTFPVKSGMDPLDEAFKQWLDASEEELHVRPAKEQQQHVPNEYRQQEVA